MTPYTVAASCIGFDGRTLVQQSITTDDSDVTVPSRSRFVVLHEFGTVTVSWEGDAGWVDYARTRGGSGSFAEDPDYDYGAKVCAARISDLLLGHQNGDYTGEELHGLIGNFWPRGADVRVDPPPPVRLVLPPHVSTIKADLREGRPVRKWVIDGDDSIKGIIMPEDRRTNEED